MSYFDSTPVGRLRSRLSSDLSIIDLELAMKFAFSLGSTLNMCLNFGILAILTWPILFLIIPTIYITIVLQFSANEWLIQRLEGFCTVIVSFSALGMTLMPLEASKSGYVGMALSFALSMNVVLVYAINLHCMLSNFLISVERLEHCMHIPTEALEKLEENQPPPN
ncbi:hypothetical protein POM88_037476 [Heracleum sosnowskyi]|uniref:ABC transmembrane type-1 domain-containing protein n=1 Tax=Heracleum sosnowskyi TaxID=360622 RepID=A0AAD8HRL8_9APIA|nr:hypothetical protein POM88_037476 [Heracleum sosnowskyi]